MSQVFTLAWLVAFSCWFGCSFFVGLLVLVRLLVIDLILVLGLTLERVDPLVTFLRSRHGCACLISLTFGPMVAWSGKRSLVLVLEVLGPLRTPPGPPGLVAVGGHLDVLPVDNDNGAECCRVYCSAPGSLQSIQRSEIWGVILALQYSKPVHLGVDMFDMLGV